MATLSRQEPNRIRVIPSVVEGSPEISRPARNDKKRIVITGGHLTPALAMVAVLKKHGWDITYFGRQTSMVGDQNKSVEAEIIPTYEIRFISLTTSRFHQRIDLQEIISLVKVPIGFFQAFFWIMKLKPQLILTFGGYLAVPTVLAAWILRIPIVIHEQTSVAGVANKLCSIFANKVALSFPSSFDYYPQYKTILTGNPLQVGVLTSNLKIQNNYRKDFKQSKTILLMGGNQGSKRLNQALLASLRELLTVTNVIHQLGSAGAQDTEWQQALEIKQKLPKNLANNYLPLRFILHAEMGSVYDLVDLVVGRCGANTTLEIGVWRKPVLLIPLEPTAYDEQLRNAQLLVEAGLGEILHQSELSPETLLKKIQSMLQNLNKYSLKPKYATLFAKDGTERLYQVLLETLSVSKV